MLPEEYKEKDVRFLYKLRNLYVHRGLGSKRIQVIEPLKALDDLKILVKSYPFPGVIHARFEAGGCRIVAYPFSDSVEYAVLYTIENKREFLENLFPFLNKDKLFF